MNTIDFDKSGGLVPAIAQDAATGQVLMMAWMNREAYEETLRTGRAVYFSRSRNKLWRKGEESGNVQEVKEIYIDCDADAVLLKVNQIGGAACHEGYPSCFFRRVDKDRSVLRKIGQWRSFGRPESSLLGVQYLTNDEGEHQGLYTVRNAGAEPWLWEGTGLADGSTFGAAVGGYGIEIDHTTPDSPPGAAVVAEIPDLFGPGLTAQMTYYETPAGAKVFSAGALDFGGSAITDPISQILENLWARLTKP